MLSEVVHFLFRAILTSNGTKSGETTKLGENLWGKASSKKTSQDTSTDTEYTDHVSHTGSSLRSKTGDGTDAED